MSEFLVQLGFYTIKYIAYLIVVLAGVILGKVWANHSAKKKAI